VDNYENDNVNAGKVGRYGPAGDRKRHNPQKTLAGGQIGTFKKWFTQIRALFGMINQMNTKKRQTSRDRGSWRQK